MIKLERNRTMDGFTTLLRGVDSGRSPSLIDAQQVSYATNTVFRGGFAQPRPGFKQLDITFASGLWQGAAFYDSDRKPGFVLSIGGRIYFADPIAETVQEISIASDYNSSRLERSWFAQVEEYMVVQNGQDKPFIWNGASSRRAATDEVPVGTVMEYGMGRLWVTLPNRRTFVAGDLVYSTSYKTSDALKFTENTFLNEGGSFAVPVSAGPITAMRFMPTLDTSLGQGPLQVFTENSVFSVQAPVDRTEWKNLTYPIQTVSLVTNGSLSHDSTVFVNGDIFYRAKDGIRSYVLAKRQFYDWGNTPASKEVSRTLQYDDPALLAYSSAVVFDNRLICTASPYRSRTYGVPHRALTVLDFDPLSSMQQRLPPAWDGVWTGGNFLQVLKGTFNGEERAYVFVLNSDNAIKLWEITRAEKFDHDDQTFTWSFESRSFTFQTPFGRKRLETADLWRDNMVGTVTTNVKYRPDQYPCWVDWITWQECATYRNCEFDSDDCPTITNYQPQYRPRTRLPQPADDCETTTSKPYREGYEFQVRLEFTGYCRVKQFRIHALHVQEDSVGDCPTTQSCVEETCCNAESFPSSTPS